jgi:pimeloyl-ACP methyl ester carboxylesterase
MRHRIGATALLLTVLTIAAPPERSAAASGPEDRYVTVNGLRLHYLDWGPEGKPLLVLIHGLDRHAHTFDHIAPHFLDRYHVIAVDMRGHGESAWDPDAHYLVEDYVRDFEAMADASGWHNIVVWGNSTGGRVAQVYAGLHPDRVSKVISEDVGPERPRQIADSYQTRVASEQQGWASEEALVAELKRSNPRTPDENLRTYVRYGITRDAAGRVIWKRDPRVAQGFVVTDLWRFVSGISSPALYIVGGRSAIVPAETQERLKTTLPRVRIVTIAGAGHYPSDEQTVPTLAVIDAFLADR